MFCSLCGAQNEDEARFCKSCGRPIKSASPLTHEVPLPAVPYRPGQAHYAPPQTPLDAFDPRDNQAYQPHVETHLALSILSMLLCCLPVGGVALYHSLQVSHQIARGNYAAAERSSQLAKWWALGAIGANVVITLGILAFGAFVSIASDSY